MPAWRGCDPVPTPGRRVQTPTAKSLRPGLESSAHHAGEGHSGGSARSTSAAGRHNRRSDRAKLTLHGPWAGEGTISEYQTKAGRRFLIKYPAVQPDGSRKAVLRRGFLTRRDAAAALREQLARVDRGVHVAPSKITVEQHFATWLAGLRKGPTTIASYRKNVRLHVVPYIGDVKLAQL